MAAAMPLNALGNLVTARDADAGPDGREAWRTRRGPGRGAGRIVPVQDPLNTHAPAGANASYRLAVVPPGLPGRHVAAHLGGRLSCPRRLLGRPADGCQVAEVDARGQRVAGDRAGRLAAAP